MCIFSFYVIMILTKMFLLLLPNSNRSRKTSRRRPIITFVTPHQLLALYGWQRNIHFPFSLLVILRMHEVLIEPQFYYFSSIAAVGLRRLAVFFRVSCSAPSCSEHATYKSHSFQSTRAV